MDPISRREAQRKADEKVHPLRHMQRAFVGVNKYIKLVNKTVKKFLLLSVLYPSLSTKGYYAYIIKMRCVFLVNTLCVCDYAITSPSE